MKHCLFLLGTLLGALAAGAADVPPPAPVTVPGFTYVKTVGPISEYTLDANGLQVLLLPDRSAPVLTFMVTYRVGSRNEVTGTTGATHLLEHLMFKGSAKFNRALGTGYDQTLDPLGAENNASTWFDRTNYYVNAASEHLPLIAAMEADRMRHLLLREEDRRPEMTVVRNEFERGENSPYDALIKEVFAVAYLAHPYHHDTIGWRSDIEKVPIEKLRAFYDTFYWPDNATVSVIGDFAPAEALAQIQAQFGAIPRAPHPIPQVYTEEPAQTGGRRVTVKRAGELGVVAVGFKTPAATQADAPAVEVLAQILASGKNSRFFKALTDRGLTTSVAPFNAFTHDPSLCLFFGSLAPGATHAQVEQAMLAEVDTLQKTGVTSAEVAAAVAKLQASLAFARDGSFAIAGVLNEAIAVGDWTLYVTLPEKYRAVTPADVQRVARAYFNIDQSSIGWFVPTPTAPAE